MSDEKLPHSATDDVENDLHKLEDIEKRIHDMQKLRQRETKQHKRFFADNAGMAKGLRLAAEFVSGILAGLIFGLIFDKFLGTQPWGLIIFLLFGFAAGLLNLYRAASVR